MGLVKCIKNDMDRTGTASEFVGNCLAMFLSEVVFALVLAPSKFSTIAKAKPKLEEIEKQKGKTWTVLVEEEVEKALSEVELEATQLGEATANLGGSNLKPDAPEPNAESVADEAAGGDTFGPNEC